MRHRKDFSISFEIFPANTLAGFRKLSEICKNLNNLRPNFISVTFGAAGAAQTKTIRTVRQLKYLHIPTAPHISCVNMTTSRLVEILNFYQQSGIKRLVVIRGDHPTGESSTTPEFLYAYDLIQAIRKHSGDHFHIEIAAYPEFHPQSFSCDEDLLHFKRKVEAGASSAITQFFFNSDAYSRFRDACYKQGITIPIIPGIMPINDYQRLLRISKSCGAEIPLWLNKRLESLSNDAHSLQLFGTEVILDLCKKLISEGAEGLHFYTLNQLNPAEHIYKTLFMESTQAELLNFPVFV